MADVDRVRVTWTGGSVVGPAVSTFYFTSGGTAYAVEVNAFFNAIKAFFPNNLSWTVPNNGDAFNPVTGELTGTWSGGSQLTLNGTAANQTIGGVGCRVVWNTNGIHKGRRVRGSTFLAPADGTLFEQNGSLNNSAVTIISAAATALAASTNNEMVVWSRPDEGASNGIVSPVTSATVPDKVSWLRSRRT